MKYKMVVLDLDGTLLDDDKQISEKNIRILDELYKSGVIITIATGRNYYMAKGLTDKLKSISPVILANNGAIIRRSHNDEILEKSYLDAAAFKKIYDAGIKRGLNPVVHVDEYKNGYDIIYERENYEETYLGYIKKDYPRARLKKFETDNLKNILSVCYFDEYSKLSDFGLEMKESNNGEYNTICNRNISQRALLEFLHNEGCKWKALKKYVNDINIKTDEILAIGDDNNDIEMILNAGMGIAMKNATEECRNSSKLISKFDNNNSGVYYVLSEIFEIK